MGNSSKVKRSDNIKKAYKMILIGDEDVGKSSIISKIMNKKHSADTYHFKKEIQINNEIISFEIWDTVGQERFRAVTPFFYENSKIVILCYDITSKSSFQNLKDYWYNQVKKYVKSTPSK